MSDSILRFSLKHIRFSSDFDILFLRPCVSIPQTEKTLSTNAWVADAAVRSSAKFAIRMNDERRCDQNVGGLVIRCITPSHSSDIYLFIRICGVSLPNVEVELASADNLAKSNLNLLSTGGTPASDTVASSEPPPWPPSWPLLLLTIYTLLHCCFLPAERCQ